MYMGPDLRCQREYTGAASNRRDSSSSNNNKSSSSSSRNGSGSSLGDHHTGNRDSGYFLGVAGNDARSRMHAADVAALWHRHWMEKSSTSCHNRKILGGSHPSNYSSRGSDNSSLGHSGSSTGRTLYCERHCRTRLEPCRLAEAVARGLLSSSARALAACPNGHTYFSWMGKLATRGKYSNKCSNWNAANIAGNCASLRPYNLVPPGHTAYSWGCTRSCRGSFDRSSDRRDIASNSRSSSSFRHCGVDGERTPDLDTRSSESRWSSWARLLALVLRVRDLESSVPFRRKLLKAQVVDTFEAYRHCRYKHMCAGSVFVRGAVLSAHSIYPSYLRFHAHCILYSFALLLSC